MNVVTSTAILVALAGFSSSSPAQTLFDYFDTTKTVPHNEEICGVVNRTDTLPRCFVVLNYSRVLTPTDDPSKKLAKGGVSRRQGSFERVEIRELMVETDDSLTARGEPAATAPRMIFVKLFWQGKTATDSVSYRDVVSGEILINKANNLEFRLIEIPTQMSAVGAPLPQRQTAQIFGGDSNSAQVKKDLLTWTSAVLGSVLPEFFKGSRYAPLPSSGRP